MPASNISQICTEKPRVKTRSKILLCVGLETDCTKLSESIRLMKFLTIGLDGQQTWMLKSPKTNNLSQRDTWLDRNSESSWINVVLTLGGLYTRTQSRGPFRSIFRCCASKLKEASTGRSLHLNEFLKTVAKPPPCPLTLGLGVGMGIVKVLTVLLLLSILLIDPVL